MFRQAAKDKAIGAKNKFQNQLGAKTAKKLELDERSELILGAEDATMYWALSARCKY